jgi:hypothetical protein
MGAPLHSADDPSAPKVPIVLSNEGAAIRTSLPVQVWGAISLTTLAQSTVYLTYYLRVAIENDFHVSCIPSVALTRRCMPSWAKCCTFLGTKLHRPSQLLYFLIHGPDDMALTQSIAVPALRLLIDLVINISRRCIRELTALILHQWRWLLQ